MKKNNTVKKNLFLSPSKKKSLSKSPSKSKTSSLTKSPKKYVKSPSKIKKPKTSSLNTSSENKSSCLKDNTFTKEKRVIKDNTFTKEKRVIKDNTLKGKFHIVLDLDATLVDTFIEEISSPTNSPKVLKKNIKFIKEKIINNEKLNKAKRNSFKERFHELIVEDRQNKKIKGYTILRPYIFEFLDFCKDFFKSISIWTAGSYGYAKIITNILFPFERPSIIFSFNNCIEQPEINHYKVLLGIPLLQDYQENNIIREEDHHSNHSLDEVEDYEEEKDNKNIVSPKISPSNNDFTIQEFCKPLLKIKKKILNQKNIKLDKTTNDKYLKDIFLVDDRNDTSQLNEKNLLLINIFEICKLTQKELLKDDDSLKQIMEFFENYDKDIDDIRDLNLSELIIKK